MIYELKSGYKNTYIWSQSKMKHEGQEHSTEVYKLKYYLWLSLGICITYGFDFPLFTFLRKISKTKTYHIYNKKKIINMFLSVFWQMIIKTVP